ncbi:MAG TPA: hypothetical protein VF267_07215 [Gammaproteobacteria bacterium]
MVSRASLKRVVAGLDRRFPLFLDLLRKSALLRIVLQKSGLVPVRVLRTYAGFFPIPADTGLPRFFKFSSEVRGENLRVLFGVTHDHPSLHRLQASVVFGNERNETVLRLKQVFVMQAPVTPPWAISALLPDCVYWYELKVGEQPAAWHTVNVRFQSSARIPDRHELPPGFRFHCMIAHATGRNADARVVDLRRCSPFALSTAEGDA